MQNRVEISISKKRKQAFDELKAFADISGIHFSKIVGNLIQKHIDETKDKPEIIKPMESWILTNFTITELENMSTLIYQLNNKIRDELCHR